MSAAAPKDNTTANEVPEAFAKRKCALNAPIDKRQAIPPATETIFQDSYCPSRYSAPTDNVRKKSSSPSAMTNKLPSFSLAKKPALMVTPSRKVSTAAAAAKPIGGLRLCFAPCSNLSTSHLSKTIMSPPATKPLIIPGKVPMRSTSGITFDATTASTAPAAKCWIALRAFAFGSQNKVITLPKMPAPVASKIYGKIEES